MNHVGACKGDHRVESYVRAAPRLPRAGVGRRGGARRRVLCLRAPRTRPRARARDGGNWPPSGSPRFGGPPRPVRTLVHPPPEGRRSGKAPPAYHPSDALPFLRLERGYRRPHLPSVCSSFGPLHRVRSLRSASADGDPGFDRCAHRPALSTKIRSRKRPSARDLELVIDERGHASRNRTVYGSSA